MPDFDTYNDKSNTNCGVRIIDFGCLAAILICVFNESRIKQILECELTSFPIALVHVITLVIVPFFLVMRSYRSTDDSVLDNRIFFLKTRFALRSTRHHTFTFCSFYTGVVVW